MNRLIINRQRAPLPDEEATTLYRLFVRPNVHFFIDTEIRGHDVLLKIREELMDGTVHRNVVVPVQDLRKFPHDYAFYGYTREAEKPIGMYVDGLPEELARKTPDYVTILDNVVRIVEFTTQKMGYESSMHDSFNRKVLKYTDLVNSIVNLGWQCQLDVIVVSRHSVLSSISLRTEDVQDMCERYIAASAFFNHFKTANPDLANYLVDRARMGADFVNLTETFLGISKMEANLLSNYRNKVEDLENPGFNWTTFHEVVQEELERLITPPEEMMTPLEIISPGGKLDNVDSISRVPLLIPDNDTDFTPHFIEDISKDESHLGVMWFKAIIDYMNNKERFMVDKEKNLTEYERLELVKEFQSLKPEHKLLNFRIEIPVPHDTQVQLAMLGVMGKRHKRNFMVEAKRKESQKHFAANTFTDDIEEFLEDALEHMAWDTGCRPMHNAMELLENPHIKTKWHPKETYNANHDVIYESLLFLADLATELAASAAQRCKTKDTFILKKLYGWDCLLLIKTTTSDKHTFFSMLVKPKVVIGTPNIFPKCKKLGEWLMYDFKSVQTPYLQTLLTLPEMYLSMKYSADTIALKKNLLAGLLVALSSKSDAEEVFTKSRYIYMKGACRPLNLRKLNDALKGLPSRPRSRLTVFLIKQAVSLSHRILSMVGSSESDGDWSNIPNFVSSDKLRNWQDVLMVIYTGYFRNKNSVMSDNQFAAMIEKIAEPEYEFHDNAEYKKNVQKGTSAKPNKMEWNLGFLMWAVNTWLRESDQNMKENITKEFLCELGKIKTIDLATLKASNVCTEEGEYYVGIKDVPRQKLLMVLKDSLVQFGPDLSTALPQALRNVSTRGGTMMISLFKKAQHAGLREIYVMDISSRIIQYCLETLGRIISSKFPNEAMTHIDLKTNYRQDHYAKVVDEIQVVKKKTQMEVSSVTTFSNDDAAKWNQNHHVQKFYCFLKELTQPILHSFLRIGLSMWLNKRIRLSAKMLNNVFNGTYKSKIPTINRIITGLIHGDDPVAKKGKIDLHVETGMMQGLLHFVSSAFHSLILYATTLLAKKLVAQRERAMREECPNKHFLRPIITSVVTSDDSVMAMTTVTTVPNHHALLLSNTLMIAVKIACARYGGIVSSTKKASHGTAAISEMNSQWMDRRQVIRPKARHILACFVYSSIGTFVEQQDQLSSLRQQALESGVTVHHVSFINYLQGLVYYRLLGCRSAPLFSQFMYSIKQMPDPNLGYFVLDPPLLSGCVPVDYNIYHLAQLTMVGTRYTKCLTDVKTLLGCKGSLRSDLQTQITFIRDKRYKSLLKTFDATGIRETLNKNPELLYRRPRNQEEEQIMIHAKLMTSSVLESLSKDYNTQARMLASSVYLIWAPLLRSNMNIQKLILGVEPSDEKKSLLEILHEETLVVSYYWERRERVLRPETKQWFFPLFKEFDRLNELNAELEDRISVICEIEPRSATTVEVYEGFLNSMPLPRLCGFRWFKIQDLYRTDDVMMSYWDESKEVYAFLRDTHEDTLTEAELEYAQTLRALLERTNLKGKYIKPASRGGRSVRSSGLATFIAYNFKENEVLKNPDRLEEGDPIRNSLRHIAMLLQIPIPDDKKLMMIRREIDNVPASTWKNHSRLAPMVLAHKKIKKPLSLENLESLIRHSDGQIGTWLKPQLKIGKGKRAKWVGEGIWTGTFCKLGKACRVTLRIWNENLLCIHTNSIENLIFQKTKLIKLMEKWKVYGSKLSMPDANTHMYAGEFGHLTGVPVYEKELMVLNAVNNELGRADIEEGELVIKVGDLTVYVFRPIPEMISESTEPASTAVDKILNNQALTLDQMGDLLFNPSTEMARVISEWLKDMIRKRSDLGGVEFNEEQVFIPSTQLFDPDETMVLSTIDTLLKNEFSNLEIMELDDIAGLDMFEERARLFEANVTMTPRIHPTHFTFMNMFMNDALTLIRQVQVHPAPLRDMERRVYQLVTGEEPDMYVEYLTQGDYPEYDPSSSSDSEDIF